MRHSTNCTLLIGDVTLAVRDDGVTLITSPFCCRQRQASYPSEPPYGTALCPCWPSRFGRAGCSAWDLLDAGAAGGGGEGEAVRFLCEARLTRNDSQRLSCWFCESAASQAFRGRRGEVRLIPSFTVPETCGVGVLGPS